MRCAFRGRWGKRGSGVVLQHRREHTRDPNMLDGSGSGLSPNYLCFVPPPGASLNTVRYLNPSQPFLACVRLHQQVGHSRQGRQVNGQPKADKVNSHRPRAGTPCTGLKYIRYIWRDGSLPQCVFIIRRVFYRCSNANYESFSSSSTVDNSSIPSLKSHQHVVGGHPFHTSKM